MNEKYKIILLSFLIIIAASALLIAINRNQPSEIKNQQFNDNNIKPRLSTIEYTVEPLQNNKVEVRSQNYAFSITIPDKYELSKGWGFDKEFPEKESVQISARDNEKQSALVYVIEIKFLNNKTVEDIAKAEIDYFKTEYNDTNPAEIELKEIIINGQKGVTYQSRNAFGQDVIVYYFAKENLYYSISVSLDSTKYFTASQRQEINEVVNSFQFIQ